MKLIYATTFEEAVSAQMRLIELSKTAKKCKWSVLLIAAPMFGIIAYVLTPGSMKDKIVVAALIAFCYAILYIPVYKQCVKRRIRKLVFEQLGTDKPLSCEYEFDETGFSFLKLDVEIKFKWKNVVEFCERENEFEMIIKNGGIAIVPKRAFKNSEQMLSWLEFAKQKTETI